MDLRPIDFSRLRVDPRREIRPVRIPEAPPLALLPMRIEYRFVTIDRPVRVIDRADLAVKLERIGRPTPVPEHRPTPGSRPRPAPGPSPRPSPVDGRAQRSNRRTSGATDGADNASDASAARSFDPRILRRRQELLTDIAKAAPIRDLHLRTDTEQLWVRWYPDENFSTTGVQPASETERVALDRFNTALGATPWWRANEGPATASAWQAFVEVVGAVRAVHLKRNEHVLPPSAPSADPALRIGRITGLPSVVHLFGLDDGSLVPLSAGKPIPKNGLEPSLVRYTPEALQQDGWLLNFTRALDLGMGVKIIDPGAIATAKRADWVIAVGLAEGADPAEYAGLLTDRIASGGFSVLPQETPTNSTAAGGSGYTRARTKPLDYLIEATEEERGRHDTPKITAAELLAQAFAVDEAILRKAVAAADQGFEDARAMLRVVGPIVLDGLLDGQTFSFSRLFGGNLPEVDENEFISILAASISARGVLPAVRFGNTAYGVLPMTRVQDLNFTAETTYTPEEKQVLDTLTFVARQVRNVLQAYARRIVPVLEPDDPSASAKLEQILKINAVSKRLEVVDDDAPNAEAKAIGCPYVQASRPLPGQSAVEYLDALARIPLELLEDPTAEDFDWPLLYRLARLSLTRNLTDIVRLEIGIAKGTLTDILLQTRDVQSPPSRVLSTMQSQPIRLLATGKVTGISPRAAARLRRVTADFAAALAHLRGIAEREGGISQLETLLFETIDLFQHRLDALSVGLAYARLARNRVNGNKALALGYYGMLGRLRPTSTTGSGDGYIQAPSQAQAKTAAVLRSAYRRHRAEGAFAMHLSGPRIRRALRLLDLLSKGHSVGEGLGMIGERWLHERRQDALIYPLRAEFRIIDERGAESAGRRVFDGLTFSAPGRSETGTRGELLTMLRDELDTLSDLIMAEAAHLRVQGLAPAANAWLQVLSGGPVPGIPTFVRTQRSGHASTHRISLAIPVEDPSATSPSLRERLEPSLAALADELLSGFDRAVIDLRPVARQSDAPSKAVRLELVDDLGVKPLDLVVGGLAEVERRARAALIESLLNNPDLLEDMAAVGSLEDFATGQAGFEADLSVGPEPVQDLAVTAERLRILVTRGRPLVAADLNAAAPSSAGLLDEATEITALEFALTELKKRADLALALLTDVAAEVPLRLTLYLAAVLELARRIAAGATQSAIDTQRALAETSRRALAAALRRLASFGLPEALDPVVVDEDLPSSDVTEKRISDLLARLEAKRAALAEAAGAATSPHATASEAQSNLNALITALQGTADGQGMPILPPLPRSAPPLQLALEPPEKPADALAEWGKVRERVAATLTLSEEWDKAKVFSVKPEATAEDPATPVERRDPQDEKVSPRTWHFGQFLGSSSLLQGNAALAGVVVDEWSEQRPSSVQSAAIAVNYDSPQSEAPSAIILAVPPNASLTEWQPESAAAIVAETIAWMQARAIPAEQRISGWTMLPGSNQVPVRPNGERRIPVQTLRLSFATSLHAIRDFEVLTSLGNTAAGAKAAGIIERGSTTARLKE